MKFFVFGTLKRRHGNNVLLREGKAKYLGDACTVEPYVMAGLMVWPNKDGKLVRGEVWEIDDPETSRRGAATLKALDRLESNGRIYQRREVKVRMLTDEYGVMPLPRESGDVLEAWLYEGMGQGPDPKWFDNARDRVVNVNCDGMHEWSVPFERLAVRTGSNQEQDA